MDLDPPPRRTPRKHPDLDDSSGAHPDIGAVPGIPTAVDNAAAGQNQIEILRGHRQRAEQQEQPSTDHDAHSPGKMPARKPRCTRRLQAQACYTGPTRPYAR